VGEAPLGLELLHEPLEGKIRIVVGTEADLAHPAEQLPKGRIAGEIRSQLHRGLDRQYLDKPTFDELLEIVTNISGKLSNLMTYLNERDIKGLKFKHRK